MPAVDSSGEIVPGKWAFDLPDTGFLFPGDVLHYYIEATDAIGGPGGTDPRTAIMPADTTGFSTDFGGPLKVTTRPSRFAPCPRSGTTVSVATCSRISCSSTISGLGAGRTTGITPSINSGFLWGEDYDIYHVNSPTSGVWKRNRRARHRRLDGGLLRYPLHLWKLECATPSPTAISRMTPATMSALLTNWLDPAARTSS